MLIFRVLARLSKRLTCSRPLFSTASLSNMPKRASTEGGDAAEDAAKKAKSDEETEPMDFSCDKKAPNGSSHNLKISAWNVAGLRAWHKKKGLDYLEQEDPDIFAMMEIKCQEDQLPKEVKDYKGYHKYWLSGGGEGAKEGYAGIGFFSKEKPLKVSYGMGNDKYDKDGRLVVAEYEKYQVVAVYVPNAGRGLVNLPSRMEWDKDFTDFLVELDKKKPTIVCGDFNVAHHEIDLKNFKNNKKNAGFTPQEREGFTKLLADTKMIDTFRHLNPEISGAYTFWTYMMNARAKDVGWRLDYFLISHSLVDGLCDSAIRKFIMGSDHCPIALFLAV